MSKIKSPLNITITTGDFDGIGFEITLKALMMIRPKRGVKYFVYRPPHFPKYLRQLQNKLHRQFSNRYLEYIDSSLSPAHWVRESADLCSTGRMTSLVTAPLSKETILKSGIQAIGHTEILSQVTQASPLHMAFLGRHFNVVLATGHIPLKLVSECLTSIKLIDALTAANRLRIALGAPWSRRPLALVGLNPHSGEGGIIGDEELLVFNAPEVSSIMSKFKVMGPLVPDAAFIRENWGKFSVYVSPYHDQGLIPFKMIHGYQSGVHVTLGLPFVRTSVDHGTAKDLFGLNKAHPGSMIEAIRWAEKLSRKVSHGI